MFALGFFSPGNSSKCYLGIWYDNIPNQTVVWVANRGAPLTNKTGVLTLTEAGTLSLINETNGLIWSTNASRTVQNPTTWLLDSGNLVVKDADDDDDRPENFLGDERYMSSWQSNNDLGRATMILLPFNRIAYTVTDAENVRVTLEMNRDRVMYSEYVVQSSVVTRLTLYPDVRCIWQLQRCRIPPCQCLDRFEPKDQGSWIQTDWSGGCVRRVPHLNCRDDVFLKYSRLKMPDSRNSSVIGGRISLDECEALCSRNCSCTAYAQLDISKERGGCLFYYGDLLDIKTISAPGQDLYIRMSSVESGIKGEKKGYGKEAELPLFSLSTVLRATNNFSMANKLDQTKSRLLNWEKRFNIINVIAKGIMYLHQDSRLRIIHRDHKASNILLDADMNPKISDFGLARTLAGNETEAKTRRVVGTYGYMSPEYAIDGVFSVKSDVFSFGVLVLEIVCGKRNRGFCLEDHDLNLLGHAWRLYKEDKTSQLVDTSLGDSLDTKQALRSIHVALLCVQKSPEERPGMSSVVFMLGNDISIAQAKEPGFFTQRDVGIAHKCNTNSENHVSMSLIQGI
ncbi:hypothetical protein SASPL_114851 [Salvia splendens]|uniref:non-specific serine/threonine protein kinase n=1 Tax=Salvia splendens TaxID=180675 RepID=A0A8X8Y245_SALSN|nr:hypothetical protein SASPL_114851 [Salvia splendens]